MKALRVVLPILLAAVTFSPIDYERALAIKVEEIINRFHSPLRYSYLGNGWFEFTDTTTQRVFRQCFADSPELQGKQPKKIIVFDMSQLDTTGFSGIFTMVDRIPIGTAYNPCVGHVGRSGRRYILGGRVANGSYTSTYAYGLDTARKKWREVHEYKGFGFAPIGAIDLCSIDAPQFAGDSSGAVIVFGTSAGSDIPDRWMLSFKGGSEFAQYPRPFDFDRDGCDEIVLRQRPPSYVVIDYSAVNGSFSIVHRESFSNNVVYGSWAVGDFDQDGKGEYASATLYGFVYVVEYDGAGGYSIVFQDTTRWQNTGFQWEGNDVDGDGKKEFVIGSLMSFGESSNLAVYEYSGDNDYDVSCWLEFRGNGSLNNNLTAGDVTGDGRDELVYSRAGQVIVLTADEDDAYRILWTRQFQSEIFTRLFDLNSDGRSELLVGLMENRAGYTEIYSLNDTVTTEHESVMKPDNVSVDCFPAPARESAMLSLTASTPVICSATLFDWRGSAVRTLLSGDRFSGTKRIPIETGALPAGIYFVRITVNRNTRILKIVVTH
jgi:hypothetical protein